MGCEDFQVMLKSSDAKRFVEVKKFLDKHPNITALSNENYEYRDGLHVIEFEIRSLGNVALSIRFALCNPFTIDRVFISLIEEISRQFDLVIQVMDVVQGDEGFKQVNSCISFKRELWQKDFGSETAALGCDEALERYVLLM